MATWRSKSSLLLRAVRQLRPTCPPGKICWMRVPAGLWRVFFDREADRWSRRADAEGERAAIAEVVDWLKNVVEPGDRIADLGCGTGAYCRSLAASGYEPVGVDFAPKMLRLARRNAAPPDHGAFVRGDITRLPLRSGSFGAAISVYAVQYLKHPAKLLDEASRVLRQRGHFLLSAPSHGWVPTGDHIGDRGVTRAAIVLRAQLTRLPGVVHRFDRADLLALATEAGFEGVDYRAHAGGHALLLRRR